MLHSSAEPPVPSARPLSAWALPWLFSTTVHALLVLALALAFTWSHPTWHGTGLSQGVQVSINSPFDGDGAGGTDTDGADPASGGQQYYDDEPALPPRDSAQAHGGGGGNDALSALLNEKPAVNLAGVLPASGTSLGAGGGGSALRAGSRSRTLGARCSSAGGGRSLTQAAASSMACSIAPAAWTVMAEPR